MHRGIATVSNTSITFTMISNNIFLQVRIMNIGSGVISVVIFNSTIKNTKESPSVHEAGIFFGVSDG